MYVLRKRAFFGKVVFKEPNNDKVHLQIISKNNKKEGYATQKACILQVKQLALFLEQAGHTLIEVTFFESDTLLTFENEHIVTP